MAEIVGRIAPEVLKERQERARTAKPEVLVRIRAFAAARRKRVAPSKPGRFVNRPRVWGDVVS